MGKPVVIVGAGLAGSLMAVYLARRGYAVDVYERNDDMRLGKSQRGRSINLALSLRGIRALDRAGLKDEVMRAAIPMKGRAIHSPKGRVAFQPYGLREYEVIYSVSRARLNTILMDGADGCEGVNIFFEHKCLGIDFSWPSLMFEGDYTMHIHLSNVETVIAADGSGSAARASMLKRPGFNYAQQHIEYGYKELTIAPDSGGGFRMDPNALHIWPRRRFMLIALPNVDGSFTCTLFLPLEGESSFEALGTPPAVEHFFERAFPDAVRLLNRLTDEFFANPTGSLLTVKCDPWHVDGRAALLGDAAHAIVPFFGQGMNCAFESCVELDRCIGLYAPDWERAFRGYEAARKPNTDAIAAMALENFIEMRDYVADERFLLRKKLEFELEKRYPERFIPRYSMVQFHHIPYAVAFQRGEIQDRILSDLLRDARDIDEVDWTRAGVMVEGELSELKKY